MKRSMHIRPYDPDTEEEAVYRLWQNTLGTLWLVSLAVFHAWVQARILLV